MDKQKAQAILEAVRSGKVSPDEALASFAMAPYSDLGYAKIDHHRGIRQGVPEIIWGQDKTVEQIAGIIATMQEHGQERVIITRLDAPRAAALEQVFAHSRQQTEETLPENLNPEKAKEFTYFETARIGLVGGMPKVDKHLSCLNGELDVPNSSYIVVVTGGTSDMPVAEEAAVTAEALGNRVERLYDVGVAGLHRLLDNSEVLMGAKVIVAVAGMEGALASVVGGLVSAPVIAVPTSVGYGAAFEGLAALLSMLNSCSSGVSVVNIDNGFGAGYLASTINHL